jgi:hypothetical protein
MPEFHRGKLHVAMARILDRLGEYRLALGHLDAYHRFWKDKLPLTGTGALEKSLRYKRFLEEIDRYRLTVLEVSWIPLHGYSRFISMAIFPGLKE